jgi:hypothetical protein
VELTFMPAIVVSEDGNLASCSSSDCFLVNVHKHLVISFGGVFSFVFKAGFRPHASESICAYERAIDRADKVLVVSRAVVEPGPAIVHDLLNGSYSRGDYGGAF